MTPFIGVLYPVSIVLLVLWGITRIGYAIDDRYVRVVLGGATLRKVALADIESVDTKWAAWNEHWCNALLPFGRVVRIRRRSGLIRNFIITPVDRDEFIRQLRERLVANRR
jgi:hypothetical protein